MARSPLRDNADFINDCLTLRKKEVMEQWGVSSGLVVNVKKEHGGKVDAARSKDELQKGEKSDIADGPNGKTFEFIRHRPITFEDAREWIRSTGDNPDSYHISIRSIAYGDGLSSNRMAASPKSGTALAETYPLSHFYAEVERGITARTSAPTFAPRATVVCVADMQLGKVSRRGGTADTLARIASKRELLESALMDRRPSQIVVADLGDGIEGFESGGNPMFTNDLSHPDQIDAYTTELFKFVNLANAYAPVTLASVASNHSAWRKGKQVLGRPSDDYGLLVARLVAGRAEAAGMDITLALPDEYDESLQVDALGTPIGFVHGNQFGPGKAVDWWQGQAFGGQAVTHCDVLVHGHYHSFSAGVAGTNPMTGRERIAIGCPTLDNGSDWFRNVAGRDSEPGLLIFDVTQDGFDLGSLKIL